MMLNLKGVHIVGKGAGLREGSTRDQWEEQEGRRRRRRRRRRKEEEEEART